MQQKKLHGLSIALLDGQEIIWAEGFGLAVPGKGEACTAATVHRVGSISKLVTDMAVMRLVEEEKLDLDAPVQRYLPELQFDNPFDKPITLRLLMTHQAGILREPPLGNYFDPVQVNLAETVQSLTGTPVLFAPGSRIKYSNAGLAVVGRVIEVVTGQDFASHVQEQILTPCGMDSSSFLLDGSLKSRLAQGHMWTYDDREFAAPDFALGMAPATNLYSTASDLCRLAAQWMQQPYAPELALLKKASWAEMFRPQFVSQQGSSPMGLGFFRDHLEGELCVGHNGAMYGFASELAALPDAGLGVAVITNMDFANDVPARIADYALACLAARRRGEVLPQAQLTKPLALEEARAWAGLYAAGEQVIRLWEHQGELLADFGQGFQQKLRRLGNALVLDSRLGKGGNLAIDETELRLNGRSFLRQEDAKPEACKAEWLSLLGEYGWDHNVCQVLEKNGQLYLLIEWFASYALLDLGEGNYRLPDSGLYAGEPVSFQLNAQGQVQALVVGAVVFPRRRQQEWAAKTFKIEPLHAPEVLREMAAQAQVPVLPGTSKQPDLVDVLAVEPGLQVDLRYATKNNFMGMQFYGVAKAMLQRPAARALGRVHRRLQEEHNLGLIVYDAYRPWQVTKMFWDATPPALRAYVANPATGSSHNRGCAVDLGLMDLATGEVVEMVSGFDEFTPRAHVGYPGTTSLQRWHRRLLRKVTQDAGFEVYRFEWWHFNFKTWRGYPLLDQPIH